MKLYNKWKTCISILCIVSILFSANSILVVAAADNSVTATTNVTVKQGSSALCYVYIDSLEDLAALDVTVHFDNTKVKINNVYNSVSCTLYDNVKNATDIQFSYIFDGEGANAKTQLFYFTYQVLGDAEVGDAYFDITIGDAYDNSLNDLSVSGSRCNFTIAETVTTKSCSIYGSSTVSTGVEKEFSLSYQFSTYQLASGSAVITYDSELFEIVSVTEGGFLSGKVTDINTELDGAVYLSFVGTEYGTKRDIITVNFRTLQNVTDSSTIEFKITELCDKDLNPVSCKEYTTTANIFYDDTYVGDAPKMSVLATYDENTQQVTALITLEEKSNLGAGDFTLKFDSDVLTVSNCEKGISPDFFNINDKEVGEGKLKFSIISLENIVSAETVLTIVFDVQLLDVPQETIMSISGDMLSDSLTNPIQLNFLNTTITLPEIREEVSAEIVRKGQTLEYKNVIFVKVIYDLVNVDFSEVDIKTDAGMLCWTEEEFLTLDNVEFDAEHAIVGLEQYSGTEYYYGKSEGIYTRYLADEVYYVGYVKLADDTYIYSEPILYGPTTYAYNMISKDSSSEQTKTLCISLLNYISAAQSYFYSDILEEKLANAKLSDEQKKLDWDVETLDFNLAGEVPGDKKVEQDPTVFKRMGKTLRFQEMISLVSIYQIDDSYVEKAEECGTIFWTAEEFANLSGEPSLENYGDGKKVEIETYGSANMWCSVAPAVAAKDMSDTCYYILGYVKHSDGTVSYSGVDSYSFEQYIYNTTTGTTATQKMITFAQRLYIYERAACEALK